MKNLTPLLLNFTFLSSCFSKFKRMWNQILKISNSIPGEIHFWLFFSKTSWEFIKNLNPDISWPSNPIPGKSHFSLPWNQSTEFAINIEQNPFHFFYVFLLLHALSNKGQVQAIVYKPRCAPCLLPGWPSLVPLTSVDLRWLRPALRDAVEEAVAQQVVCWRTLWTRSLKRQCQKLATGHWNLWWEVVFGVFTGGDLEHGSKRLVLGERWLLGEHLDNSAT